MIDVQTFEQTNEFSTSGTKEEPDASKRTSGMAENEGLPYEYFNYYINLLTKNNELFRASMESMIDEMKSILTDQAISPDVNEIDQILTAIKSLVDTRTTLVHTTGAESIAGDKTFSGIILANGGIGITDDTNLLGLTSELLTVNGSIKVPNDYFFGNATTPGLLQLLAPNILNVNGKIQIDDFSTIGCDGTPGLLKLQTSKLTLAGQYVVTDTTSSTDKDTGSIVTNGGLGVEENINAGGNITAGGVLTSDGFTVEYRNSGGTESTVALKTKIIEIGDWNIDSTSNVNVNHGITNWKNIRHVSAIVRNDDDTSYSKLVHDNPSSSTTATIIFWNASQITLARADSCSFDNSNYDSTSYNRGWIYVIYED